MPSTSESDLDVLIVSYARPELLQRGLEALVEARGKVAKWRVRIHLGIRKDDTLTLNAVTPLLKRISDLHLHRLDGAHSAGAARNQTVKFVNANWLLFLDDDAVVATDFFLRFERLIERFPQIRVVGGPNLTADKADQFARATGGTLSSRFGAALSAARYRVEGSKPWLCQEYHLTSCNLFIHREHHAEIEFPDALHANEENWLLQNFSQRGIELYYAPSLHVVHERRPTVKSFVWQIYGYGVGRGQNIRLRPATGRLFHYIPAVCVLLSLITLLLGPWWIALSYVWFFLAFIYLVASAVAARRVQARQPDLVWWRCAGLFPLVHVSYGLGLLRGFVRHG